MRIEQRNAVGGHLYIARNTFDILKSRFEPPDAHENPLAMPT